MKIQRLLNAIKKAGFKVTPLDNNRFHVSGGVGTYGTFIQQDDRATCVSTCNVNDKPDAMIDYFPQTYHDTIKSFIRFMNKQWALNKDQQDYFNVLLRMGRTNEQAFEESKNYKLA